MADHVDVDKHVKTYVLVFVALMALTVVTVAVSYLEMGTGATIAVALLIALVKGTLVAGYFMHLLSEKKLIYAVLIFTVIFFLAVLLGPVLTNLDEISV